jgi:serine/threonine protein kinase HipA of HipAB toxin-antitoxin module
MTSTDLPGSLSIRQLQLLSTCVKRQITEVADHPRHPLLWNARNGALAELQALENVLAAAERHARALDELVAESNEEAEARYLESIAPDPEDLDGE